MARLYARGDILVERVDDVEITAPVIERVVDAVALVGKRYFLRGP